MEFCQHLSNFDKRDPLMIQSLIKYSVMELRHLLKKDVLEAEVFSLPVAPFGELTGKDICQALQKQNEMFEVTMKREHNWCRN